MKKGIIVLLIAVLISGFAFAGFSGYAGIEFGVDLDEHTWGFANPKYGKYTFKFTFDSAAVKIGEDHKTDVWAELEAAAEAYIQLTSGAAGNYAAAAADVNPGIKYTAKITKANIHIGDIVIGILNAGTAVDYAKSYYKVGNAQLDKIKGPSMITDGFTVTYDGWYGGFGARGIWDDDSSSYLIWGHGKTKSFEFADGLTGEAGGYAVLDTLVDHDKYLGGGLKVDYKQEKLTAGIAGDGAVKKGTVDFGIEGAIYATYALAEESTVRLDIYGASRDYFDYYTEDDFLLKLDAKVSANYTFNLSDDIALAVEGWVDARDVAAKYLALEIGAKESTAVDAFTFELTEIATLAHLADKDLDAEIGLEVEAYVGYEHEKFTAYADLIADFVFDKVDNTDTFSALNFEAGISSDAIIEGATLALVYGDNTFAGSYVDFLDFENHKGAVTASCTITF